MEDTQEQLRRRGVKDPSRRDFLRGTGVILAAGGTGYLAHRFLGWAFDLFSPKGTQKTVTPSQPTSVSAPTATPEKPVNPEALSDIPLLDWILSMPPNDEKRKEAEMIYANRAKTLEQVDRGLWALASPDQRGKLLGRRFDLRQNSTDPKVREKLTKLDPELIAWAKKEGVPREVLGICFDTYKIAERVIQKLVDKSVKDFRPDLFEEDRFSDLPEDIRADIQAIKENPGQNSKETIKSIKAGRLMMNIGGMAMLMNYETGGFANIGNGAALEEVNLEVFSQAESQMEEITQRISKITGLKFVAKNIPGSMWTPGNKSGGAIGPQFMPGAALEMMNLFEGVGETLNIFHPSWAVIASWVFLARSQWVGTDKKGRNLYREGYLVGTEDIAALLREYTVGKWNPNQKQIDTVIATANRFSNRY